MKPYYEHGGITIYHGDCREVLPQLESIDLVLTDPPYGVGVDYGAFDDTPASVAALVGEVVPCAISRARTVALTCGTRQIHMYPPTTWVLCWLNRAGSYPNPWGFTCWQPVLVYGPDPFLARGMGSRSDVLEHSETAEKNGHPVPKPEGFWKKLLCRVCLPDDLVVDPFMGSGTTLRVAKDMCMSAVGIEIEERYCEIAAKRLSQEVLFAEAK
jgi:site-specific DNA-methyltransferase (adenine-specific)